MSCPCPARSGVQQLFSELKKLEKFKFEWRGTLCWIGMVKNQELHSNVQVRTCMYRVSHSKKLHLNPCFFSHAGLDFLGPLSVMGIVLYLLSTIWGFPKRLKGRGQGVD